jgi:hypothetical protein
MKRFAAWLFASPLIPTSIWRVIGWWEVRRIPFNIVIGVYGVLCLLIFFWAILTSGELRPGEDAVEPIALIFAPLGINVLYTLGWLVEVPARLIQPSLSPRFGPFLLMAGLGLGLFLISLPAAFWGVYLVLQMIRVL